MMGVWSYSTTVLLLTGMDYGFAYRPVTKKMNPRNNLLKSNPRPHYFRGVLKYLDPLRFPVHNTDGDLRWGWLGQACETTVKD